MKGIQAFFGGMRRQANSIFRDAGVFTLMVAAPLLYGLFYPLPYLNDRAEPVRIGIVDQESGSLSRQLIRWMQASPKLEVAAISGQNEVIESAFRQGDLRGILWLPTNWERDFRKGIPVTLPVAGDGASFLVAREALLGFAQVSGTLGAGMQIRRIRATGVGEQEAAVMRDPLRIEVMRPLNPTESYLSTVYLSVIVLILQQTLWLGMAMARATRRARGDPGPLGACDGLGAFSVNVLLYGLHALILTGPVFAWLQLPLPVDRIGALLFLGLLLITWTAYGSVLGELFRSRESSPALWVGTSIPMLFLAGTFWPVESMPGIMRSIAGLLPSTPAIQGMVQFWALGASLEEVRGVWLPLVLQLGGISAVYACIRFATAHRRR